MAVATGIAPPSVAALANYFTGGGGRGGVVHRGSGGKLQPIGDLLPAAALTHYCLQHPLT